MKIEFIGGDGMWSSHGEHERGVDPPLKACPFCKSFDIEVWNTHTPYYTGRCNGCGAEGPRTVVEGADKRIRTRKACEAIHRAAFQAAIEAWNSRVR